jgi:disulfide bond formation protein DsbB
MNHFAQKAASLFALMITIILVITLYMYHIDRQEPCPLCYLQQASMIGIALMELLNVRFMICIRHYIGGVLFSAIGATISSYQLYLNDFSFYSVDGVNFLGLHLFVWSLIIFSCSIIGIILLLFLPNERKKKEKIGTFAWIVISSFLIVMIGVAISSALTTSHFSWYD